MKKHEKTSNADASRDKACLVPTTDTALADKACLVSTTTTEIENLRLIHELEVHQIELEMQNDELKLAKEQAALLAKNKYIEMYDFAPSGYFTLSREGEIVELNLTGAVMLGKDHSNLIRSKFGFGFFVSDDTKSVFALFLEKLFKNNAKESCDVTLATSGNQPVFVHLSGIAIENGRQCMITAVDITERKHTEKRLQDIIDTNPMSIQILDIDGYTIQTNSAHFNLFGAVVPEGYSLFNDPELLQQGLGELFDRVKKGEVISFPDSNFNPHDVDPSFPDTQVTIKVTGFPLFDSHGIPENIVLMQENITSRKLAEDKLRLSEEKFRNIFETMQDTYYEASLDGTLLEISPAIEVLSKGQYSKNEMIGKSFVGIYANPDARNSFFSELFKQGSVTDHELLLLNKDGSIIPVAISSRLLFDADGKPAKINGSMRDITVRKKAEEELKKLSQAITQSPVIIFITDLEGNIEYANPKTIELIGYDLEELIGKNPRILSSGEKPKEEYRVLWETLKSGKEWRGEFHNKKKNGEFFWSSASISPIFDSRGKMTHYLAVQEDITERKQKELELRDLNDNLDLKVKERTFQLDETNKNLENEIKNRKLVEVELAYEKQRLFDIIKGTNAGTWEWNVQTGETIFNEQWADIFGYSLNEISPVSIETWMNFAHPDDLKISGELLEKHFKGESDYYSFESRMKHKNGEWVWVLDRGKVHSWTDDGKPLLMSGTHQDITERKQAEEKINQARNEAENANRAKSEFLSRMSHDLRTPMTSILGYAQLLEMGELTMVQKNKVTHILNSGNHMLKIINVVLDLSRIEAGKILVSPEPVKLRNVILEMIDAVNFEASKRFIEIELTPSFANSFFVKADRQLTKQVLINILNNAIKYNREGGHISIKTELMPITSGGIVPVRISVSDTGEGISSEDIKKLFIAFERIGAEKTKIEGTGLGLSVVKKFMDEMGGNVGVESVQGEGSTFWIELPLIEDLHDNEDKPDNLNVNASGQTNKSATILYIEDNLENVEFVELILALKRSNIRLISDVHGKKAVGLAIEFAPDLILLDIHLPDIHGHEVIELLQKDEKTKNIPIVVVSVDVLPEQIEKTLETGIREYLTKPIEIKSFLRVIDENLGKS